MNEQIEKVVNGVEYAKQNNDGRGCTGCAAWSYNNATPLCDKLRDEGCAWRYIFISTTTSDELTPEMDSTAGVKYDNDKLKYSLIPSYALEAVAQNLTDGLKKYPERDNWMKVDNAQERYLDALYRHLELHRKGEIYDTDSINPENTHIAAVVANAMFLLEFMLNPKLNKGENK